MMVEVVDSVSEVTTMKRPDLLILIVIWQFMTAAVALFGVIALAVFAYPEVFRLWGEPFVGGIFGLSMATLVLLTLCGLAVASAVGIILGKEWGRIASIVHSALSTIWIPIGTVVGILALVYLTKTEVRDYFQNKEP